VEQPAAHHHLLGRGLDVEDPAARRISFLVTLEER
jgi:hypothetical protein